MRSNDCPFCNPTGDNIFLETDLVIGLWDSFPVTKGHALLIPRRHVADWFAASRNEQLALIDAIPQVRDAILEKYQPGGFNFGVNIGETAGQTVPHLHLHVIPRYEGDVPDPTGGVRYVIPHKANYVSETAPVYEAARVIPLVPKKPPLIRGGSEDPFLSHLLEDIESATRLDIAVAFVTNSGLDLIEEYLHDLLSKPNGAIRFLTGDYNDVTDPTALHRLLDMDGNIQLRVFECRKRSFHPKSYLLSASHGHQTAYIGSSNLTHTAMQTGIEWNYRIDSAGDAPGVQAVTIAFESLFRHPDTRPVDRQWIESYRQRRCTPSQPAEIQHEAPQEIPTPHSVQEEALKALEETRRNGNSAGMVVLATGLGKTWLSAFDSNHPDYQRILFVAHREEILDQAIRTFRRIRPDAKLGRYTGTEKTPEADVLFASVQTLSRLPHLRRFARDSFDYIVIDEFHHAAARTYRRLIDYFDPKFLLGLTATPERTDGGDLLALCQENVAFRCDLAEGIRRELLSPFHYFGVPDDVDYSNIPWRSSRFDETELTNALATTKRAQNALEQYRKHGGTRTLGFCCSVRHANFMAKFFLDRGVKAVAVHSAEGSAPRAKSLDQLRDGELEVLFAVDIFNEGVDIPAVDTILMLRPTESRILWIQQFGRGLRRSEGKERLNVVDYIGNHRTFLLKPQTLFDLGTGDHEIARMLKRYNAGQLELPPGCEVTYDLKTVDILQGLLRRTNQAEALRYYFQDFQARTGERPTAIEAFHDGYNPGSTRQAFGSWFGFVESMEGLTAEQARVYGKHRDFLEELCVTPMTKSYKMLLLLAMLNNDSFPGEIGIDELVGQFQRLAQRSQHTRRDVGESISDLTKLRRHVEINPIEAWTRKKRSGADVWFDFVNGIFRSTISVDGEDRAAFQELTRELCDWRLGQYLARTGGADPEGENQIVCKVLQSNQGPVISLPDRKEQSSIPHGETPVLIDSQEHQADFARTCINVLRKKDGDDNVLHSILKGWFGDDAGMPGTRNRVCFERNGELWELSPWRGQADVDGPKLWAAYLRAEIPGLFDVPYKENFWRQGFIKIEKHFFLLVTLEKKGMAVDHQYEDHFLSPDRFQWQSQNRQARTNKSGAILQKHAELGFDVHLFIRKSAKAGGRAAPFVYCGDVDFVDWEGDSPITVEWALQTTVPDEMWERLGIIGG
jgi:superfamily II DNA or RNA helicase/diadenosine tetraphosphate (Ap4A) HIT family hydrolase